GPVDVLVNNAGIPAGFVPTPFRDLPVAEWDKFIRLNLYGVLYCTKAVVDGMCERGWGRLVTISSDAARVGLPSGIALYGAGKAGAVGFSRHLAMELQGTGVTGAGGGLGREYARLLAARGAAVVVNDLGGDTHGSAGTPAVAEAAAEELRAAGSAAVANSDSVATPEGAATIIRAALDVFGR